MPLVDNTNTIFLIVTFFPEKNLIELLEQIKERSFKFILVDNSYYENYILLDLKNKYFEDYFFSNKNINGISGAYNLGFNFAIIHSYKYVITLDQDSLIGSSLIKNFNKLILILDQKKEKFGAIGVSQNGIISSRLIYTVSHELINSGSLIATEAYKSISGFDERYFIDNVDFDFYLRLYLNNHITYKILNYSISHKLGIPVVFRIFNLKINFNKYSAERLFHFSYSNIIFLKSYFFKSPFFCFKKLSNFSIYLFKSLFFCNREEKKSILLGISKAIK